MRVTNTPYDQYPRGRWIPKRLEDTFRVSNTLKVMDYRSEDTFRVSNTLKVVD